MIRFLKTAPVICSGLKSLGPAAMVFFLLSGELNSLPLSGPCAYPNIYSRVHKNLVSRPMIIGNTREAAMRARDNLQPNMGAS